MKNDRTHDIFDVIYLLNLYCDLKNEIYKEEEDYLSDENCPLNIGNKYYRQLDGVDLHIIDMVEKDVEDTLSDEVFLGSCFEKKEFLRKKYYGELGIEYKTMMEFFPDIRFF